MRPVLALIIFAALCYAAVTAYAGFRVARGIDKQRLSAENLRLREALSAKEWKQALAEAGA